MTCLKLHGANAYQILIGISKKDLPIQLCFPQGQRYKTLTLKLEKKYTLKAELHTRKFFEIFFLLSNL